MPPIASLAFRGTARELTWYPLVALTPNAEGIACNITRRLKCRLVGQTY